MGVNLAQAADGMGKRVGLVARRTGTPGHEADASKLLQLPLSSVARPGSRV